MLRGQDELLYRSQLQIAVGGPGEPAINLCQSYWILFDACQRNAKNPLPHRDPDN